MAVQTDVRFQSSQNTDTTRTLTTVIRKHIREEEVEVLRNHRLTAKLENDGRVQTGVGGAGFDWEVRYRLHDVNDNNGTDPRNFVAQEMWKIANLEYRGYQVTDAISKKEKLAARGQEAIINVASKIVDRLKESIRETFARELYIDGEASGNTKRIHGIESMMGMKTSSGHLGINYSTFTGTGEEVTTTSIVMMPDDTYAGLSTALGNYGGSQISGIFPLGVAEPQYDFYSPVIVNTGCDYFDGTTDGFASNARESLSFGILNSQRNSALADQMDMVLMDRSMYYLARNRLTDAERIIVTNKTGLRSFGFKQVFEIDGVECSWEYGTPLTSVSRLGTSYSIPVAYGFNTKNMTLYSMQDELFKVEGPEYDIDTQHDKVVVDFLGNLKFSSPRRFVKWGRFSGTSSQLV